MFSPHTLWLALMLLFRDPGHLADAVPQFLNQLEQRWILFHETIRNTGVVIQDDGIYFYDKRIVPRSGDAPSK